MTWRKRRFITSVAASVTLGVAAGVSLTFVTSSHTIASAYPGAALRFDALNSDLTPASASAFADFALYALGNSFDSLPLRAIVVRKDTQRLPGDGDFPLAYFATHIYAECTGTTGKIECGPSLEVQVWPACARNPSLYSVDPAGTIPLVQERLALRGVPAIFFPEDPRLEVYSSNVTIVIFGQTEDQMVRAAAELRGVNNGVRAGAPLPQPAVGAMQGRLRCA